MDQITAEEIYAPMARDAEIRELCLKAAREADEQDAQDVYDPFDAFDEYNDLDATACANGDYNTYEEYQLLADEVAGEYDFNPCDAIEYDEF